MIELTSLDLHYAVRELSQLVGSKVEKIFQSDTHKRDVFFIMYKPETPKVHLRFLLPGMLCKPKEKPVYPQLPPGFSMFLRKHLSGTRLQSVEQVGFDRILKIIFASKTVTYQLVIEFMAPGNMLLLDSEGRILNLLENQQFKDRTLRARQPYVIPPSLDITKLSHEELCKHMTESTRDSIVTTLAIACSLGGIYAEEVCVRTGIAKGRNDLNQTEIALIAKTLHEILDLPMQAHADEKRVYPFKLQSKELKACEDSMFLNALCTFIAAEPLMDKTQIRQRVRASPETKLQSIIDAQRAQVARLEVEIGVTQRKGERIYEEYQILQEVLHAAQQAREKKQDITEALRAFPQVKSYNKATGELSIEIEDT